MNNSFYGGRDGQPMVIKAKFASVENMTTEFAKPEYAVVNFGEYALIETVNRKNPENGFLFRRGYDYQDENRYVECWEFNDRTGNFDKNTTLAKGAIYIGKIAGPAGDAPLVEFKNADTVKDERDALLANIDSQKEVNGNSVSLNVDNGLIAGRDSNGEITYHWYSVRDTNGVSSKVCLGFKIPYYDIEFNDIMPVSPGTAPSIERELQEKNPFHEKWTFKIPEGIPGNSVEWINVIAETEASNFNLKTFKYDENGIPIRIADTGLLDLKEYSLSDSKTKQILIARIVEWDKKNKVETLKYVYLADYRTINKITYSEPGFTDEDGEIQKTFDLMVQYGDGEEQVICKIDPLRVGASFSFGKYSEPGEDLRLNGIHFVLEDWDPSDEDHDLIHYPGGVLQPYSEEDIIKILEDADKESSNN